MAWTESCELFGVEGPDGKGIMALVYALKKAAGLPGNLMGWDDRSRDHDMERESFRLLPTTN
jgi:hypothetical protein